MSYKPIVHQRELEMRNLSTALLVLLLQVSLNRLKIFTITGEPNVLTNGVFA